MMTGMDDILGKGGAVTGQDTLQDDEAPPSRIEAAKRGLKKHKKTTGAVALAGVGLAIAVAKAYTAEDEEEDAAEEVTPLFSSPLASEPELDEQRPLLAPQNVPDHLMKISGQPSEAAKAAYAQSDLAIRAGSDQLPDRMTYRQKSVRYAENAPA